MPIFARDILKVGVVQYGWLSAAQSIGAVAAALVMSQITADPATGANLPDLGGHFWDGDHLLWPGQVVLDRRCWR